MFLLFSRLCLHKLMHFTFWGYLDSFRTINTTSYCRRKIAVTLRMEALLVHKTTMFDRTCNWSFTESKPSFETPLKKEVVSRLELFSETRMTPNTVKLKNGFIRSRAWLQSAYCQMGVLRNLLHDSDERLSWGSYSATYLKMDLSFQEMLSLSPLSVDLPRCVSLVIPSDKQISFVNFQWDSKRLRITVLECMMVVQTFLLASWMMGEAVLDFGSG